MWRNRDVRDLLRSHANELQRRDEMIQQLLDRIQHPDRTPIWREEVAPLPESEYQSMYLIPDPDQLPA